MSARDWSSDIGWDQPMVCIWPECRFGQDEPKTMAEVVEHQVKAHSKQEAHDG